MRIIIQSGNEYMECNEKGEITRPQNGAPLSPSQNWKIVGAVERNGFGHVTRKYSAFEVLNAPEKIQWRYKNGVQKTFLLDFDHGSIREWRSPSHCVFTSGD